MNTTFGTYLRTTVWGQSHAAAIGCTVEGLPAGEAVDEEALCAFMGRRAPGGRLRRSAAKRISLKFSAVS